MEPGGNGNGGVFLPVIINSMSHQHDGSHEQTKQKVPITETKESRYYYYYIDEESKILFILFVMNRESKS